MSPVNPLKKNRYQAKSGVDDDPQTKTAIGVYWK